MCTSGERVLPQACNLGSELCTGRDRGKRSGGSSHARECKLRICKREGKLGGVNGGVGRREGAGRGEVMALERAAWGLIGLCSCGLLGCSGTEFVMRTASEVKKGEGSGGKRGRKQGRDAFSGQHKPWGGGINTNKTKRVCVCVCVGGGGLDRKGEQVLPLYVPSRSGTSRAECAASCNVTRHESWVTEVALAHWRWRDTLRCRCVLCCVVLSFCVVVVVVVFACVVCAAEGVSGLRDGWSYVAASPFDERRLT